MTHCRKILQKDDVHQRVQHEEWSRRALNTLTDIYDTAKKGQYVVTYMCTVTKCSH